MRLQNSVKHLRWSLFPKQLMALIRSLFLQNAPYQMLDKVLNTPMKGLIYHQNFEAVHLNFHTLKIKLFSFFLSFSLPLFFNFCEMGKLQNSRKLAFVSSQGLGEAAGKIIHTKLVFYVYIIILECFYQQKCQLEVNYLTYLKLTTTSEKKMGNQILLDF